MSKRKPVPFAPPAIAGPSRPDLQRETSSPAVLQNGDPSGFQEDVPNDEPPMYSGPSIPSLSPNHPATSSQRNLIVGLPDLPWSKYQIPEATISPDATTITTTFPLYSSEPRALEAFLRDQASLPPRLTVRILGRSDEGLTKDFDIRLNMMHYIVRRGGPSQQWNYVQVDSNSAPGAKQKRSKSASSIHSQGDGLKDVVDRFCDEKAMVKTFTLTRNIVNWNTEYIQGSIRNLLAQINYRGQVTIQFPTQLEKIVVQSPTRGNKFLHGIASLFSESKNYGGVTAVWPYATLAPSGEGNGGGERICAVQTEEAWWKDWKTSIAGAVRAKRKGWVSVEDQIEFAMMPH
ncbi:MAG: hypothetical protein M1822_009346 [Bathelium mastoideum]|nr:MAG: hypothetical protein M1822_009346 [Bathelium mastoideum]